MTTTARDERTRAFLEQERGRVDAARSAIRDFVTFWDEGPAKDSQVQRWTGLSELVNGLRRALTSSAAADGDEAPLREALRDCANLAERNGQVNQYQRYTHPIIDRARALAERCPKCAGDGWFEGAFGCFDCADCKGTGRVVQTSQSEARHPRDPEASKEEET